MSKAYDIQEDGLPYTLDLLKNYWQPNQRAVLLFRHAKRQNIDPDKKPDVSAIKLIDVHLTPDGEADCLRFGAKLSETLSKNAGSKILRYITSGLDRTKKTLEKIQEGSNGTLPKLDVEIHPELMMLNVFATSIPEAVAHAREVGLINHMNMRLQGDLDHFESFPPIVEARVLFDNYIRSMLSSSEKGAILASSHDVFLAAASHIYAEVKEFNEQEWPGVLEAMLLWMEGDKIMCWRRGKVFDNMPVGK